MAVAQDYNSEDVALRTLYRATNGKQWQRSVGWMKMEDHCTWYGVECTPNDRGNITRSWIMSYETPRISQLATQD